MGGVNLPFLTGQHKRWVHKSIFRSAEEITRLRGAFYAVEWIGTRGVIGQASRPDIPLEGWGVFANALFFCVFVDLARLM